MNAVLWLHIVIEKPLAGIDYALQSGSGSKFDLMQRQVSGATDMVFELSANIKGNQSDSPDFGGAFVQGARGERFIYIGIGTYAGNPKSVWGRRLKVPFRDITWEAISKIMSDQKLVLETRVPGTGKDGTPTCATVKPFSGWYFITR